MANYHISRMPTSRNPLAWRYRPGTFVGWSFFPDKAAESLDAMKHFLSDNGKMNPPALTFTDDQGRNVSYVEVKRLKDKQVSVRINGGERSHVLRESDFIPYDQQLKYYQAHATPEFNEEMANKEITDAIKHYRECADLDASDGYFDLLKERTSDEAITTLLKSREGENSIVLFCDE